MLKKNSSGHYTKCNTQVGQYSRKYGKGFTCTCPELVVDEIGAKIASPPKIKPDPYDGFPDFMGVAADEIKKDEYGWVNLNSGVQSRSDPKVIITFDLEIENLLNEIRMHLYGNRFSLIEKFEQRLRYLEKRYNITNMNQLIEVGMDIDLRNLTSNSFVIKPLRGQTGYTNGIVKKGTFWVFSEKVPETPPFYLFEFPSAQVNPKTDLVMLVDPYEPEEDYLTETIYHKYGIRLMKKFNIKDARVLLEGRKRIFDSAPTATNTILLFQLMDAIILNDFKTGALDVDKTGERNLVRLEKLKSLALDTKFNEERKNAVDKCFIQYNIISSQLEEKVG